MGGSGLPLEYLLLVTTTTYVFSFLITMQLQVIYKHSAISVLHLLFICWEALTPLLTMSACSFTMKLLLPLGSPAVTARSSVPMEHRALPAPCLVSPKQTALLSHLIPVFRAGQSMQLTQLTPQFITHSVWFNGVKFR